MCSPLILISLYLTEKERKKALKSSSVKVAAMDVVASYKILCGMVCFLLIFIYFKKNM